MTIDKGREEGEGLFHTNWHKCPNGMIDHIAGIELKPGAFIVVLTVIRYTEGMGGKKSAAIPTETFMRVLGTNRPNTVYEHVKQAVRSGLVQVIKKSGCVNHYSVNQESDQWRKVLVVAESASSVGKRHRVVSESDTGVVSESDTGVVSESDTGVVSESDTLIKTTKDNVKDNIKDNIKDSVNADDKSKAQVKKTKSLNIPFNVFWKTYAKSVARDKCEAKWESLSEKVREQIMQHLPAYVASTPTKRFRKDPMTYLNRKGWLDDIIVDEPNAIQQSKPSYSSMNVNAKYEDPDYDPLDGLSSRTGAPNGNY